MLLETISWLNNIGSGVTAFATVVLVLVTIFYAYITKSILDDQKKTRKIQELHKKLECFYIPLWQHIMLHQYPPPEREKAKGFFEEFNKDTVYKDFMKYMYLCKNKKLISILEKLLNQRSGLELQDKLISHHDLVENDIKELVQELEKLQSF